jgi:hypothetical protein
METIGFTASSLPLMADFVAKVGRSRWLICHFVKGGRL